MCNVVAHECEIGNGSGNFMSYEEVKNIKIDGAKIKKASERLYSAYGCNINNLNFVFETLKELNNIALYEED
jgi:Cys-tRNA synthase (O-phospho-L-seryl-tRNA:Cys-tRNA synthase)